MSLKRVEFTDPIFAKYLKLHAEPTNPFRQKAAKMAAEKKKAEKNRSIEWMTFDQNADTYFVKTNDAQDLWTMVLGWNHVVCLHRENTGGFHYSARHIYCFGKKGGKEVYGNIDQLNSLKVVQPPVEKLSEGSEWHVVTPLDVKLERVVTYGVSSCSLTVLTSKPRQHIFMSHLDGKTPIPVGFLMAKYTRSTKGGIIASVFPEENELHKYEHNKDLLNKELRPGILMLRGKCPYKGSRDKQNPQMAHTEIGLRFDPIKGPFLEGTIGLQDDINYSRIIPTPMALRLKALSRPEALKHGLLFTSGPDWIKKSRGEVSKFYEKMGHCLSSEFKSKANLFISDQRPGIPKRRDITYEISKVDKDLRPVDVWNYPYVVFERQKKIGSGEIVDERDSFHRQLDFEGKKEIEAQNIGNVKGFLEQTKLELGGEGSVITTNKPGKEWQIHTGQFVIRIKKGSKRRITRKGSEYVHLSATEPRDIIYDLIKPIQVGKIGFKELHIDLYKSFISLFKQHRKNRSKYFKTEMEKYEAAIVDYLKQSDLFELPQEKDYFAFAMLLGHFLVHEGVKHPYAQEVEEVVRHHRYELSIPVAYLGG